MKIKQPRCFPIFDAEDHDLLLVEWRPDPDGYARARFDGARHFAHRLVLSRALGRALRRDELCDHLNRDRLDCRRSNLQLVTCLQNSQNRRATGKSGLRGACFNKNTQRWQASVKLRGKSIYCGSFDTAEEAAAAAHQKRLSLGFHGEAA